MYMWGNGEGNCVHLIQLAYHPGRGMPGRGIWGEPYAATVYVMYDIYVIWYTWDTVGEGGGRADEFGVCKCE